MGRFIKKMIDEQERDPLSNLRRCQVRRLLATESGRFNWRLIYVRHPLISEVLGYLILVDRLHFCMVSNLTITSALRPAPL